MRLHCGKTIVLEAEIEQPFTRSTRSVSVGEDLPEQAGFSGPAHANHSRDFAMDVGQPGVAARESWQRRALRIQNLLPQY
jgi:hypothetical protein